jgi:hypothetical protein
MYQVTESNVVTQLGYRSSTFTLDDDANVMPQVVLEKLFKDCDQINAIVSNQKEIDKLNFTNVYLAGLSNG